MSKLAIVKVESGEQVNIQKATPLEISEYLTDVNYKRRKLEKVEKAIKKYVLDNRNPKYEDGRAAFGNHKIVQSSRGYFDKKRFKENGTKEERGIIDKAKEIQEKYQTRTVYYRWN